MSKKLERCIKKVKKTSKKLNPYAICKGAFKKSKENKEIIEQTYKKYKKATNMTYTELLIWSKNPCSKKASQNRNPINRNLKLLKKNKPDWNMEDVREANKVISYLARAKKIKRSKTKVKDCKGLTKNEIALMNWSFNPYKK